jgi:hypothetical protein
MFPKRKFVSTTVASVIAAFAMLRSFMLMIGAAQSPVPAPLDRTARQPLRPVCGPSQHGHNQQEQRASRHTTDTSLPPGDVPAIRRLVVNW